MVRRLVGAGCVAALALATAGSAGAAVPGPGPAGGFYTFTAASQLHGTGPVGDLSSGFDVWIDPHAAHVTRISAAVRYVVGQLSRYGLDVRYRGVAARTDPASGLGVISVSESAADSTGCTPATSPEEGEVIEGVTFPRFQDVGVATRIEGAQVRFCPPVWSHDQHYVTAIALHELGHAVGLGHFSATFEGKTQVMNPIVPDLQYYQAGDVNGLRYIAAQTATLRADSKLSGDVESWQVEPSGLAVSGWAVVGTTSQFATVTVTRDGSAVYKITTNTARPDIVARTGTLWPNPGFSGSEVAMVEGRHTYCVIASASGSASVGLGCRTLAYPPAEPSSVAPSARPTGTPAAARVNVHAWWSDWLAVGGFAAVLVLAGLVVVIRRSRPRAKL